MRGWRRYYCLGLVVCLLFWGNIPVFGFKVEIHHDPNFLTLQVPYSLNLVWRWAQSALEYHNVEVDEFAGRTIQTAWIRDPHNFNLFDVDNYFPNYENVRSRLTLRFHFQPSLKATEVFIHKDFEYFKSIFDGWLKLESDLVEEGVIAHRIRTLAYYHYVIDKEGAVGLPPPSPFE